MQKCIWRKTAEAARRGSDKSRKKWWCISVDIVTLKSQECSVHSYGCLSYFEIIAFPPPSHPPSSLPPPSLPPSLPRPTEPTTWNYPAFTRPKGGPTRERQSRSNPYAFDEQPPLQGEASRGRAEGGEGQSRAKEAGREAEAWKSAQEKGAGVAGKGGLSVQGV